MHAVSNSEFFYCAHNYKEVDDFRFEDFCHVDGCEYFPNFQDLTERASFFADAFLFVRVLIVLKPICVCFILICNLQVFMQRSF